MSTLTLPAGVPVPAVARRSLGRAVFMGVVTVGLLVFPLLVTALFVPKFEDIFKDFGVALPALTREFIRLGHVLASPIGLAVVTVWVLGAIALVVLLSLQSRLAAAILLTLGLSFSGAYLLALLISMFLPLVAMIESLQQGGAV